MSSKVNISIITATFNCIDTLDDCFDSLSSQTYKNYEHIIIDGGSTDGTTDLIKQHIDQISAYVSEQDNGIYDALNKGIRLAKGDIIGFLHADDLYTSSDVLLKIAKAFEDSSVCAVYGNLEYVSQEDTSNVIRLWKSNPFIRSDLYRGWMPAHPTLYVRRAWYSKIGAFDTKYKIAADYMSVIKLFSHPEFKSVFIPEILVTMRLGGSSNKSISAITRKTLEDWQILRHTGFSINQALYAITWKNLRKITQFLNFNH